MNATERAALLQGIQLYDEMTSSIDERTLEILDRRRRTAVVHRRGWLVRRALLLADLIGLLTAFLFAEWITLRWSAPGTLDARGDIFVFASSLPLWAVVAKLYGLYDRDEERTGHSTPDDFVGVFHMLTVCTWAFALLAHLTGVVHPTLSKLAIFWVTAVALVSVFRASARGVARRTPAYLQNAVVVGAGDVGQLIARKLLQHPEYGINLVGFVDERPKERGDDLEHLALLGGTQRLPAIVRLFDVERVIIAFSNESHEHTLATLRSLKDLDVQIDIVPRFYETVGPRVGIHTIEGIPLLGLPPLRLSWSSLFVKRSLDVAVSASVLLLLLPLVVAIALAVKVTSKGSVFYRDQRIGRSGEVFRVLKFRSMYSEGEVPSLDDLLIDPDARAEYDRTRKLACDPRVTPLGRFLRRTSLDELPQLMNVVRGDVSLVGPRPITKYEYDRYLDGKDGPLGYWEFDLRPGLTGFWQINGRSSTDYNDRLRLDAAYVGNWSLRLDLEILAKTLRVLLAGAGAY